MKKKITALMLACTTAFVMLAGCSGGNASADTDEAETDELQESAASYEEGLTVRVGGLKGPTTIGLLPLKDEEEKEAAGHYEFTMATAADELTTALVKGELDIALIPANVASVLYNKTEGNISVIDINTLGVLYLLSGDESISDAASLEGRTIYLTGKGTTPDYVMTYILKANDMLDKVTLEYKSEAAEVAAILAEDPSAVGLLPQPFATAACIQNDSLKEVMDMTAVWDELNKESGSRLVTGVTVVRNDFLNDHKEAVNAFLEDHARSVESVLNDTENAAKLAVENEIVAKEPIAQKAIPKCNITCITGEEMKEALTGYLTVLYDLDPSSIGGKLPGEEFYYIR